MGGVVVLNVDLPSEPTLVVLLQRAVSVPVEKNALESRVSTITSQTDGTRAPRNPPTKQAMIRCLITDTQKVLSVSLTFNLINVSML